MGPPFLLLLLPRDQWISWINSSLPLRPGLDLTFATQANIPVTNTLVGIDPDGGAVNYSVAVVPSHGAVQITGAQSGAFIYTPATDYVGADAFVYQVADSGGLTDTATVTVTMSPPSTGAIEGVVFDDLNGNGRQDPANVLPIIRRLPDTVTVWTRHPLGELK